MKWSIGLGRILGIRFRVHLTFLLLLAFFALVGTVIGGLKAGLASTCFLCLIFVCVTVHELAHSLVARSSGVRVDSITLLPIGGVATMRGMPDDPLQEILISVAGPATSISIFSLIMLLLQAGVDRIGALNPFSADPRVFLLSLASINLFLGLFNLLPAFPMDGGRILRGLLALALGFDPATRIATAIGQGFAVIMILSGIFSRGGFWFVLIGAFIFLGASSERRQARFRAALRRFTTAQVMLTRFRVLAPDMPLSIPAQDLLQGYPEDFAVVRDGHFIGILLASIVVQTVRQGHLDMTVGDLVSKDLPAVAPGADLDAVQRRMLLDNHQALPVAAQGHLVGIITRNRISRFLAVHSVI